MPGWRGSTCELFDTWGLQQLIGKRKEVQLCLYLQLVKQACQRWTDNGKEESGLYEFDHNYPKEIRTFHMDSTAPGPPGSSHTALLHSSCTGLPVHTLQNGAVRENSMCEGVGWLPSEIDWDGISSSFFNQSENKDNLDGERPCHGAGVTDENVSEPGSLVSLCVCAPPILLHSSFPTSLISSLSPNSVSLSPSFPVAQAILWLSDSSPRHLVRFPFSILPCGSHIPYCSLNASSVPPCLLGPQSLPCPDSSCPVSNPCSGPLCQVLHFPPLPRDFGLQRVLCWGLLTEAKPSTHHSLRMWLFLGNYPVYSSCTSEHIAFMSSQSPDPAFLRKGPLSHKGGVWIRISPFQPLAACMDP